MTDVLNAVEVNLVVGLEVLAVLVGFSVLRIGLAVVIGLLFVVGFAEVADVGLALGVLSFVVGESDLTLLEGLVVNTDLVGLAVNEVDGFAVMVGLTVNCLIGLAEAVVVGWLLLVLRVGCAVSRIFPVDEATVGDLLADFVEGFELLVNFALVGGVVGDALLLDFGDADGGDDLVDVAVELMGLTDGSFDWKDLEGDLVISFVEDLVMVGALDNLILVGGAVIDALLIDLGEGGDDLEGTLVGVDVGVLVNLVVGRAAGKDRVGMAVVFSTALVLDIGAMMAENDGDGDMGSVQSGDIVC